MVMVFNRLMSEQDNYPEAIAAIVSRLVSGDRAGAERDMAGIAYTRRTASALQSLGRS
jgi:hypothetical protein